MAAKNKNKQDLKLISQKTPDEVLLETILSDEKQYLFSASAEQQLIDMHQIREMFFNHGSRSKVVEELVKENGWSYANAWKAVTVTPQIFATIPQSLTRAFWVDLHLQKIEKTWKTALELGDARSMALSDKNRDAAIEKYLGTNQMIEMDKLHLPDVEYGYHPELFKDVNDLGEGGLEQLLQSFRRKKKIQQERQILDIDYEAIHE